MRHWRLQATDAATGLFVTAAGSEGLLHAPSAKTATLAPAAAMNIRDFLLSMVSPMASFNRGFYARRERVGE